jgi:23S rRNA (pseudouridine1915-N3)-methyltransferase
MKLRILTIGAPKLAYAQIGWQEYLKRLQRYHTVRVTHLADKFAHDTTHILKAAGKAYKVVLAIGGNQFSTEQLADFLDKRAPEGREVCFIVGGPEGLPQSVIEQADLTWSFSKLTFPHDLAMVILLEALYRASTVNSGHPYHRAKPNFKLDKQNNRLLP